MKGIMVTKRYFWVMITTLLLTSISLSSSPAAPLLAEDSTRRDDMLAIAERYATYPWTANDDGHNIMHENLVETPDAESPGGLSIGGWLLHISRIGSSPGGWDVDHRIKSVAAVILIGVS